MEIEVNRQKLWFDFEAYKAEREFTKNLEQELWNYHFSGQRTIDLFGEEEAKIILEEQRKEEHGE